MVRKMDYEADHYCPAYKKVICADLCYDSMMCLNRFFKVSSTKELEEIEDVEQARVICSKCPYSQR